MGEETAPVIVIKKIQGHGGHHGGAWKVAYADFVTAMMALFIVLWLLSSSEKVKKAVSSYFQDPTGQGKLHGSNVAGAGSSLKVGKENMDQLKDKINQAMKSLPKFSQMKDQIQMIVTGEGLRIELLETDKGMFFQSGSAQPSAVGNELLKRLAAELGRLPNFILVEGHTDAKPFTGREHYGNWELSSDRANAARRLMESAGLRQNQVNQVRGFADQHLRRPDDPGHASNRRISVIVQYVNPTPGQPDATAGVGDAPPPTSQEKHH